MSYSCLLIVFVGHLHYFKTQVEQMNFQMARMTLPLSHVGRDADLLVATDWHRHF